MRRTKILATLGPVTESEEALREMIRRGVNIFRINMSHAKHDWVREICARIRKLEKEENRLVGILLDTQGPEIRTGDLPTNLELNAGDTFTFTVRGHKSEEEFSVDTNYDDLISDINEGDVVLVDNGVIEMVVRSKTGKELTCEVLTPGKMGSRRHINLPGIKVNLPALTKKDIEDIKVGIECGIDYIALSFVREAEDIAVLRNLLKAEESHEVCIIAKVEDQSAVRNLDAIIQMSDGVMVARGDLGVECPIEELPIIQRRIIKNCVAATKPVIVATHMLESMIQNPLPTRAEVTDVSNAVFEEADAIMLSGETTVGKYPYKCVEVLDRVSRRIERSGTIAYHEKIKTHDDRGYMATSAVHLSDQIRADGLCVFTRTGMTARLASALRPRSTPIFAITPDEGLARRMIILGGVIPIVIPFTEDHTMNELAAEKAMLDGGWIEDGARLVVVSDIKVKEDVCRSIQLRQIPLGK